MKQFSRSKLIVWALIHAVVFLLATTLIPRFELMTILNGIFLGIVTAVVITYFPLVVHTIRKGKVDRVSQLALGISLIWVSIAAQKIHWLIWYAYGMPISWRSNPFLAAMGFLAIIGGGLFVTAPGYPAGSHEEIKLMGANRNMLIFFGATGGLISFIVSMYLDKGF